VAVAARGVARWLRVCDAALVRARAPRAVPADRALLRYLAWRVAVEGESPDAAAAALRLPGPRRPRAIGDDELLRVARALPRPGPDGPLARDAEGRLLAAPADPAVALALRPSVPDAMATRLLRDLGPAGAAACLAALNRDPRLTLRVNAARATRGEVVAALRAGGIDAAPGAGPWAVRVEDRAGLFDSPPFRDGLVEVQDESSQAAVELCRPRPGERWLDLCAGSGGKALALAALGATVSAWDASARRLADLPRRARRAGARVAVLRAEPSGSWDGVLVDAPCSGSGALAREPDARWRIDDASVARLAGEQAALLDRAAPLVRPGGALAFATCSLFREEGEEVVARFLQVHPEFRQERAWRRWPHLQPGAGFFAARLRRRKRPRP
jgi:16S rRNA (cytosine967-C5)-methyltransferase